MTLADRIADLTAAIANAINARSGMVGASTYDLYVQNGGTASQAQWLAASGPRVMTATQRNALSGGDLWRGRLVEDQTTGWTWRYNGSKWCPFISQWADITSSTTFSMSGGPGGAKSARYRWDRGLVRVQHYVLFGGGGQDLSQAAMVSVPEPINAPDGPLLEGRFVALQSDYSTIADGAVRIPPNAQNGGTTVQLCVRLVNGNFSTLVPYVNGQPWALAQSQQFWSECIYESLNYPL